tara:strand:+ start:319 stop:528 length:210 start_codon:yes stop_codon:yes gene_type:complete
MSLSDYKEEYRLFWIVKGHLGTSHSTVLESYNGYFNRMWGNHETCYREEGFEEAWTQALIREIVKNEEN